MDDWPDAKIRNIAQWYIRNHATNPESWRYTRLTEHQPVVLERSALQSGELPIVTSHISDSSWYALTTRRIVGAYDGCNVDVAATDVSEERFVNFKGRDPDTQTEIMILVRTGQPDLRLEYETGRASMAPIYYFRFWWIKYPILNKLKHNPEATKEEGG